MHFTTASVILAAGLTPVSAITGSVFPLYVYPSKVYNDNAAAWQSSISAIKASPKNPWLVVVNPDSGPGNANALVNNDVNLISGLSQLNALSNVKSIGYVHTSYSTADMNILKQNITAYSKWATYQGKNTAIKGIFFDESSEDATYLTQATTFAKQAFNNDVTTICNFGTKTSAQFYDICDIVVAFESTLNSNAGPAYKSGATIDSNFVKGREGQGSIIINQFTGTAADGQQAGPALLNQYVKTASDKGVGWVYFTAADYNNVDSGAINIGNMGSALAAVA